MSNAALLCSDAKIYSFVSVSNPVFIYSFHSPSGVLVDSTVVLRCHGSFFLLFLRLLRLSHCVKISLTATWPWLVFFEAVSSAPWFFFLRKYPCIFQQVRCCKLASDRCFKQVCQRARICDCEPFRFSTLNKLRVLSRDYTNQPPTKQPNLVHCTKLVPTICFIKADVVTAKIILKRGGTLFLPARFSFVVLELMNQHGIFRPPML